MEPRSGGNGRGVLGPNFLHGSAVTSMLAPIHKQGHLGDLEGKSKAELQDLLQRQEKILNNRRFIMRLPDKGEKIQKFAATLRGLIAEKERRELKMDDEPMDPPKHTTNNEKQDSEVLDAVMETDMEDNLKVIERGFEQLSFHEGPFYQVVVKAEEKTHKSRFALNRPHKKDSQEVSPTKSEEQKHHLKDAELTSASVSDPVHGSATVISVDECRSLYSDQQKKIQEIKSQRMYERVMRRMNNIQHPEGAASLSAGGGNMEEVGVDFNEPEEVCVDFNEPAPEYLESVD